ncbi:hypothetical protein Q2321_25545, partial [Escherichia coli]|nr:hypothetical protein [Escherichia coli]
RLPVLGQVLQLSGCGRQQVLFVAVTHGTAKRQGQVVLRQVMGVVFALTQQVADIEHLQQPPVSLAQE